MFMERHTFSRPGKTSVALLGTFVLVTLALGASIAGCRDNAADGGAGAVSDDPALRDLAASRSFQIGAASLWPTFAVRDRRYTQILSGQFNQLEIGSFQWDQLRPSRDRYDFWENDHMADFGLSNGMTIEGMHLVWGAYEHLPAWLISGGYSRDELIGILHDHVTTVVSRYRGKVSTWVAVNEAVSRAGSRGSDFWNDNIGPDYVGMVFRWAREADPGAVLIYNDGGNEDRANPFRQSISDGTYELVKRLKQQGVPIDGVGMQMHIMSPSSGDENTPPRKEDVIDTMKRYAGLGVGVFVTEFDVNLHNISGSHDERLAFEAGVYRDMLGACLESGVCRSFTTFGFTDAITWYNDCEGCLNLPDAEPLPYDADYQPKPAYAALQETLKQ